MNQEIPSEEQLLKDIGEKIKSLRIQSGKTQQQIADIVGIEESALRRIEGGRTNPTVKTLKRLSIALEISLHDVFENF